jgi:hypothetical protein
LHDGIAGSVLRQCLEDHRGILVPGIDDENRSSSHAVERLANDFAVFLQKLGHIAHVAGDPGRRAAFRKPRRVHLLVHVAQALRPVQYGDAERFCSLEDVGGVDVLHVEGGVLAHQDHIEILERARDGLPPAEPVRPVIPNGQWREPAERHPVVEPQMGQFGIVNLHAAPLCGEQHGEGRVLGGLDILDGIHDDAESDRSWHSNSPFRQRSAGPLARYVTQITP